MPISERHRIPRLHCLTTVGASLEALAAVLDAGADAVQVRDKHADTRALFEFTQAVLEIAQPRGAAVIVNDRLDVALAAGATGVHLGKSDLPVASARALAPDLLIGATCRSSADVALAAQAGADYAGVGPVLATTSKDDLPAPLGLEGLSAALHGALHGALGATPGALPVIGIGGVTADNAALVVDAGAHGVAVIGGIWNEADPAAATVAIASAIRGLA